MKTSVVSIKDILGRILFYGALYLLLYATVGVFIETQLLKHYGVCTKGVITSDLSVWTKRYTNMDYLYEFYFEGKIYRGNSLIHDDPSKIGDSICVVFLESYPRINHPLTYFHEGHTKCNCK